MLMSVVLSYADLTQEGDLKGALAGRKYDSRVLMNH